MTEVVDRLKNCNTALLDLYRNTDDEEIKAEINNVRTPVVTIITEIEFYRKSDSLDYAEEVIADTMKRIKTIQDEIAGAATMRSTDLSLTK